MSASPPPRCYAESWPVYLRAHSRRGTRALHYIGTVLALDLALVAVLTATWQWVGAALAIGYGCAWASHAFVERNRPATFGHPLWSLRSDFRMLLLAAAGRLEAELWMAGCFTSESPAPEAKH